MFILLVFDDSPGFVHNWDEVDDWHVVEQFADFTLHDLHPVHIPLRAFHLAALNLLSHFGAARRFVFRSEELEYHVQRVDFQFIFTSVVLEDTRVKRLSEVEHGDPEDGGLLTLNPVFDCNQPFDQVAPVEPKWFHGRLRDVVSQPTRWHHIVQQLTC